MIGVTMPYGDWVTHVLAWAEPTIVTFVMALIAYAFRQMPGWAVALLKDYTTQTKISRAIHFGLTQIDHEMIDPATGKYRALTLDNGNAVLSIAENYMLSFLPDLAKQLGDNLKPRLLAEIAKLGMAPTPPIVARIPAPPQK